MGRLDKIKRELMEESNKRMLNEQEEKYLVSGTMIRLKSLLTEQPIKRIAIGGLIINNAIIEKVGDSIQIIFGRGNIPADSQLVSSLPKMIWDCTMSLSKNGNMVYLNSIRCTGEGKYEGKDVESAIMTIVDDFPKPADTNNFSQNILTAFEATVK